MSALLILACVTGLADFPVPATAREKKEKKCACDNPVSAACEAACWKRREACAEKSGGGKKGAEACEKVYRNCLHECEEENRED
jgi:hypothetical protein